MKKIVILTGAGISKDSGIKTYRDEDGHWTNPDIAKLSRIQTLMDEPDKVLSFYGGTLKSILSSKPNEGHFILASIQDDYELTLITQNIDGYHQEAGSRDVIEVHGSLRKNKCIDYNCTYKCDSTNGETICPQCGKILRPDIVLFGETLDGLKMLNVRKALRECDVFIAIGTSGTVYPAAGFVDEAQMFGAETVYINVTETDNIAFSQQIMGGATSGLKEFFNK